MVLLNQVADVDQEAVPKPGSGQAVHNCGWNSSGAWDRNFAEISKEYLNVYANVGDIPIHFLC